MVEFFAQCWEDVKGGVQVWRANPNIPMTIYMAYIHIAAVAAVFYIPSCTWQTLLFSVFLYVLSGLGITAGAHRLWLRRGQVFRCHAAGYNAVALQRRQRQVSHHPYRLSVPPGQVRH